MSKGSRRSAGWAAAALALLSGSSGAAAPAERAHMGRFELVTYNVAGLPEGISHSRPLANLPLIGKLLNRYDLALVQEDFAYPFELRRELRLPHATASFVRGDRLHFGDGLSQFARLPFNDLRRVEWSTCHGLVDSFFDCLTPKGFTVARLALGPSAFVHVVNLHMDAGWSAPDRAAREAQVKQLAAALDQLPSRDALIVAGDTNIPQRQRGVLQSLLKETRLADACTELDCPEPGRIDRVLYRSSPELRLRPKQWRIAREFVDGAGRPLSDHLAVAVAFDWHQPELAKPALGARR